MTAPDTLAALSAKVQRIVDAARARAVHVDEMSYHGEAMVCDLCGATWNNGAKRNEDATPEAHKPECPFTTAWPSLIARALAADRLAEAAGGSVSALRDAEYKLQDYIDATGDTQGHGAMVACNLALKKIEAALRDYEASRGKETL